MPKWNKPGDLSARLERLVDKLLEYLPEKRKIDWSETPAAQWRSGGFAPLHTQRSSIRLSDILGCDTQKVKLINNTRQFLSGFPANHVLLWGARGTGKSSLIHALLNDFVEQGLRLIEVEKSALKALCDIVDEVHDQPYKFILYCDDLSFQEEDDHYKELKSALEGSIFSGQSGRGNTLIYATSNRRHLIPEYKSENEGVDVRDGQIHLGDQIEEKLSLSDRFGVWLSFYPISQTCYLQIVEHWVTALADQYWPHRETVAGPELWGELARKEALKWSLEKGSRSGRTAYQFAVHWVGQRAMPERMSS